MSGRKNKVRASTSPAATRRAFVCCRHRFNVPFRQPCPACFYGQLGCPTFPSPGCFPPPPPPPPPSYPPNVVYLQSPGGSNPTVLPIPIPIPFPIPMPSPAPAPAPAPIYPPAPLAPPPTTAASQCSASHDRDMAAITTLIEELRTQATRQRKQQQNPATRESARAREPKHSHDSQRSRDEESSSSEERRRKKRDKEKEERKNQREAERKQKKEEKQKASLVRKEEAERKAAEVRRVQEAKMVEALKKANKQVHPKTPPEEDRKGVEGESKKANGEVVKTVAEKAAADVS